MNTADFRYSFDVSEIRGAVSSMPFLSEKRLVILRGLVSSIKKADSDEWIEIFKNCPDSTIVIFYEEDDVSDSALFKALSKEKDTHVYEQAHMRKEALEKFIERKTQEYGASIDSRARSMLAESVGIDLWKMENELRKLSAFADSKRIDGAMVEDLVAEKLEERIFELMDAVSKKDAKSALNILTQERRRDTADMYLFTMLVRQVRILLLVRDELDRDPTVQAGAVAKNLKLHPFVAEKSIRAARQFNRDELIKIFALAFDLDRQSKTGFVKPEIAVDLLVASMLGI